MLDSFFYISKKELLHRVDQESVWRQILGSVKVGDWVLNPFRPDKNKGSCKLHWMEGTLRLIDFADKSCSGFDCIEGYKRMNPNLSWTEICTNLLNLNVSLVVSSYKILPGLTKEETKFECFYREWQNRDLEYWFKRGVEQWQLDRKETLVRPIEGFIKHSKPKVEKHFGDLSFAYHFDSRVKIYFPEREKPRFIGNAKQGDLWHLKKGSDILVIQKSHKDLLVLDGLSNCDIVAVQSEQSIISPDILFEWESYYSKIFIWFDADDAGQKGANLLKSKFLYTPCTILNTPPELDAKDASDIIYKYGSEHLKNFIKKEIKI